MPPLPHALETPMSLASSAVASGSSIGVGIIGLSASDG